MTDDLKAKDLWERCVLRLQDTHSTAKIGIWLNPIYATALTPPMKKGESWALICGTAQNAKKKPTIETFGAEIERVCGELLGVPVSWELHVEKPVVSTSELVEPPQENAEYSGQVRLPFWKNDQRGIPNVMLRNALFGTGEKREFYIKQKILCIKGYEIERTGETLNQGDFDVWMTLIQLATSNPLGTNLVVSRYEVLKEMELTDGGENFTLLEERIARLTLTRLRIKSGKKFYNGGLVNSVLHDKESGLYRISFDENIKVLFEPDQHTKINWGLRAALRNNQLAQWLHGSFGSHAEPFAMRYETARGLSDNDEQEIRRFKAKIKKAGTKLITEAPKHGESFAVDFGKDTFKVSHGGTLSQQNHLERVAKEKRRKAATVKRKAEQKTDIERQIKLLN